MLGVTKRRTQKAWVELRMQDKLAGRLSFVSKDANILATILGLGLVTRLVALPFSYPAEGDAVFRVRDTVIWMSHPFFITQDYWLPLHTYLVALSIWIGGDRLYSPVVPSILFNVASAIPLYYFIKNEFSEKASGYVTCAYLFYPVVFRQSLMAMAQVIFQFFLILALFLISQGRRHPASLKYPVLAGLSLTLAGMLRYEGWFLIPMLALLLWKTPRRMVLFVCVASFLPILWLLMDYLQSGAPFYTLNRITQAFRAGEGYGDPIGFRRRVYTILYYPLAIPIGMNLLVAIASVIGLLDSFFHKRLNRVWAIPLIGYFLMLEIPMIVSRMPIAAKYTIDIGMMLLPFSALVVERLIRRGTKYKIMVGMVIALMIPFSFLTSILPYPISLVFQDEMKAIPLRSPVVDAISRVVNTHVDPQHDGLICDYIGWAGTYSVLLFSGVPLERTYGIEGHKYFVMDTTKLSDFLKRNPTGILVLKPGSQLDKVLVPLSETRLGVSGLNNVLGVEVIQQLGDIRVLRYRLEE
jgi:hypothetical protein